VDNGHTDENLHPDQEERELSRGPYPVEQGPAVEQQQVRRMDDAQQEGRGGLGAEDRRDHGAVQSCDRAGKGDMNKWQ